MADEIKADQPTKDRIQKNERPQHKVVITKPFLLSATEVTIGQFKQFAVAAGYQTEAEKAAAAAKAAPPPVEAGQPPPKAGPDLPQSRLRCERRFTGGVHHPE